MSEQNEGVEETQETQEPTEETKESSIANLEDALKVIDKLRKENAAKRVKTKEVEEKAKKWEEYLDSQKTELEKLTESKADLERQINELRLNDLRSRIAREEKVPEELIEFLDGSDEADIRNKAKKLASKVKPAQGATDFFAGQRGTPVTKQPENLNDFFVQMWKDADSKSTRRG